MIALEQVTARRSPTALTNLTATWGPGVHSVLGRPTDGGPLLLEVIAGARRPQTGTVRLLDGRAQDPEIRAQVARIPVETMLPDPMRVSEALEVAGAIRREPPRDARERLRALGVEALADRRVASLSRGEARAVALAEGLTSTRVRVLLVEEPLTAMDPRAAARLPEALQTAARAGRAVLLSTASIREAGELADEHTVLRRGRVVLRTPSLATLAGVAPDGAHLLAIVADEAGARALAARLAPAGEVESLERQGRSVRIGGPDASALARAIARAVSESGVDLTELRIDAPIDRTNTAGAGGP